MKTIYVKRVKYRAPRGDFVMVPLSAIHQKVRWMYEGKEVMYEMEVYTSAAD